MRTRREPRPARRPRIVTARMVVVAMVGGVVGAVVSVVVCAVVWELRGVRMVEADLLACWHADGHTVLVSRYDYVGVTYWDVVSAPDADESLLRAGMAEPRMRRVERVVWPASVRTPLDGEHHGRSSHRYGWPRRAAERTDRWDAKAVRRVVRGTRTAHAFGRDWAIPTLPMWPGLLGNTAFFGVMVLASYVLLRWRKLYRRAKRGLCLACAYRLGEGVKACPECGLAKRAS